MNLADALQGCLLGTAAGDSIGLPFENLSRASVELAMHLPLEQSLLARRGLVSDDTEHTLMVALTLLEAGDDARLFARRFAARLRWWLLALPPGVGGATARATLKLWLGFPPDRSGVHSAGNGPAMRAALFGVVFADRPALLRDFVRASTRVTHTDPRAFDAALAVAVAAGCASRHGVLAPAAALERFTQAYRDVADDADAFAASIALLGEALRDELPLAGFAQRLGCADGITGFAPHTVAAALYAWLRHAGDFRTAVTQIVRCGGDTDSTAAIVGAIVGAGVGAQGIPPSWLAGIAEWPRGVAWMRRCSAELAAPTHRQRDRPRELAWLPWALARNLAMLVVVLWVLVRRTLLVASRRAMR